MTSGNNPEKQESQPPRPESTSTEGHEAAEQAPITVVDVLHTLVNEYKARDEQNSRIQNRNFWLGVGTACLLFFYTTVTALQWYIMRNSFYATQRAAVSYEAPPISSFMLVHLFIYDLCDESADFVLAPPQELLPSKKKKP